MIFGLLLGLNALSSNAQTNLSSEIERLLPVGKCKVDIMGLAYPKRFLELTEKLQSAVATNKVWWMDYVKNAQEGEPLPYSPKLGLTEKEYEAFLSLAETRTLAKTGNGTLQVQTNLDSYEFNGGSTLPDFTGLKINLKQLTITTPFAVLKNPTPEESHGGSALGAFSAFRWYFEQGDLDKGDIKTISFSIGTQKESGRKFIYYKAGEMRATNSISNVSVVIFYDKNVRKSPD